MNKKKTIGIVLLIAAFLTAIVLTLVLYLPATNEGTSVPGEASIHLAGDHIEFSGTGAELEGNRITIKQAGTYEVDGTLNNGQIRVKTGASENVTLVLNNISLTNPDREAIYVKEAGSVVLELKEGTKNTVCSGNVPDNITENENLFSQKEDSSFQTAVAALQTDDNAKRAAIYSKGDLTLNGTGKLHVFGYIKNGIQAKNKLHIQNGEFQIIACNHGMKGNAAFIMENGTVAIIAGNDGIRSDQTAEVKNGAVMVLNSDEGIEANQITVSGGNLDLTANDDGMNACTAEDADGQKLDTVPNLHIQGGTVAIHASGDGIDSNGNLLVSGGELTIDGPENDGNGAIDSGSENNGTCKIDGGTIIALGSSGMAEGFEESSKQCSFLYNSPSQWPVGTKLTIYDEKGTALYKYTTKKTANSIVFSSPALKKGNSYTLEATDTSGNKTTETIKQESVSVSAGESSFRGGKKGGFHPDGSAHPFDGKRPPDQGHAPGQRPEGTPPGKPAQDSGLSSQN